MSTRGRLRRAVPAVWITLAVLGAVTVAPGWWWRRLSVAAVAVGRHWLPVLLLVAGLGGLVVQGTIAVHRRRRPGTARRRRREPVAVWLPLSAHIAGLLLLAVVVAVGVGVLLWWALGSPTVHLTPASTAPPAGTATPAPGGAWTVQNTFDAMKIVLSVVAGIGAVVALTVAYRKQDQGEAAEHREDTKLFNERFGRAADQLGAAQAAVRLAGVYAMAGLADDWGEGRQTCIDVLCAYLRMPYTPPADRPNPAEPAAEPVPEVQVSGSGRDPVEQRQVRHTVLRLIRDHLRPTDDDAPRWHRHHFDLTAAVIDGGDLSGVHVSAGTTLDFYGATFSGGTVGFYDATFSGGTVDFSDATFCGGAVNFYYATFSGGWVTFSRATFSGGTVGFPGATFSGGRVNFSGATLSGGAVGFPGATFSGPTFSGPTLSGGWVDFSDATLSGGTVGFPDARFSGGRVDFSDATFSGGTVDLTQPGDWSRPPVGLDGVSTGVLLPSAEHLSKIASNPT
jgi:uncharacterized protein YjbI with pentapeptide repeats